MTSPNALTARAALLDRLERLPPGGQRAAIKQAIDATDGWLDTDDQGCHGFGIHLMGVYTVGTCIGDAVHHWICTTRTLHGGWTEPSPDTTLHGAQIAWASWVLARQATCRNITTAHLPAACQIVLALSANETLRTHAHQLLRLHSPTDPANAP